jgi:hypothetical protein
VEWLVDGDRKLAEKTKFPPANQTWPLFSLYHDQKVSIKKNN